MTIPLYQPVANRFRYPLDFGVGIAFDAISPLDFESHIAGPTLGALAKAIVESSHGLDGEIYQMLNIAALIRGRTCIRSTPATYPLRLHLIMLGF